MDRRRFLQMVTGGGVALATVEEAGIFAEFYKWLTRRPVHFIPAKLKPAIIPQKVAGARLGYVDVAGLSEFAKIYYNPRIVEHFNKGLAWAS